MRFLTRKLAAATLDAPETLVMEFGPNDQLIVQAEHRVPRDVLDRLRAQLIEQADSKVIVLESGLKLVGRRTREDVAS